jgi:hypothetical protein
VIDAIALNAWRRKFATAERRSLNDRRAIEMAARNQRIVQAVLGRMNPNLTDQSGPDPILNRSKGFKAPPEPKN